MDIAKFSIKNPLLLNLLTAVILIAGTITAVRMNREAFPAVDFDNVVVSTVYPGASPTEVELYVTNLIEEELKSVTGINEMSSSSLENLSKIVIKLDPDLSERAKATAVNDIKSAVERVQDLPDELLNPPLVTEMTSSVMPVLEINLYGNMPYKDLHQHAEKLKAQLEQLGDARDVVTEGFFDREVWIEVDPDKLQKMHIGMSQVIQAVGANNLNLPGGTLDSAHQELLVRTVAEARSADDIADIVIRSNDSGVNVKVKDVAQVVETFEESSTLYKADGFRAIKLVARKKSEGDIIELVTDINEVVTKYLKRPEAGQLRVAYTNDISIFVKNRLGVLVNNGFIGTLLVLLALLLFLSRGIAVVAALGMPVAFIGAILVMNMIGLTINLLTLFALVIVLGMLVDDAIIVAENIWQHYEKGKSPTQATIDGTKEVFWPVCVTIMTTIAAFSPLLMVSGIFGKFIAALPKVVIVALIISLIEAMLILPSHAYDALKFDDWWRKRDPLRSKASIAKDSGFMHSMIEVYTRWLQTILNYRYVFVGMFLVVLVGSLFFAATRMKLVLFPTEGVEGVFVRMDMPVGTTLRETEDRVSKLADRIRELIPAEELRHVVGLTGIQQMDAMDPFTRRASHLGQVGVFLVPEKDRDRSADQIIAAIREEAGSYGKELGFEVVNFTPQRMGPPVGKPVALRVIGQNLERMRKVTDELMGELDKVEHVFDISQNFIMGKQELNVHVDTTKASRAMLSTRDVAAHVRAMLQGQIATHVHFDGERIPVRVRFEPKGRESVNHLEDSKVANRRGLLIPLSSVATIEPAEGLTAIYHLDNKRVITISANIDERNTTSSLVNDAMKPVIERIASRYPDIFVSAGGEYEETSESMESMRLAFLFALAMIFVVLASQFQSLTQPFVIMSAIPFGIIGVLVAFHVHGLPLSFLGFIGIIGLSGVVVNDSIVLVDFINKERARGLPVIEAATAAGRRRFRAVWLTSITTIFGLLPLVYGIGGHDMFLRPAAMALGYGLLFATVLILLLVPAFYVIRVDLMNLLRYMVKPFAHALGLQIDYEKLR